MKVKVFYEAFDGTQFSDLESCDEYEKQKQCVMFNSGGEKVEHIANACYIYFATQEAIEKFKKEHEDELFDDVIEPGTLWKWYCHEYTYIGHLDALREMIESL